MSRSIVRRTRAAVIRGLGISTRDLKRFQNNSDAEWLLGLPSFPDQADVVLLFGGDGTVHRHLPQLLELGLPVLVVPAGSGNDFARALGHDSIQGSLKAWQLFTASRNNVRAIDVGVITSVAQAGARAVDAVSTGENADADTGRSRHYFCCVAGCGLDADIARRANRLPQWLRSYGGYALSLPVALAHFAPIEVKISSSENYDDYQFVSRGTRKIMLMACANTPVFGAGMRIAPRATMDDGKLDVCSISEMHKLKLSCLFPTVYSGRHLGIKEVEYFQTPRVRIDSVTPADIYADGEYVCQTPVEIGVLARALRVITADGN